jgi:NAD(P)-dependent dehydrogenase (short-subunit alcohol dehydrogenase family)
MAVSMASLPESYRALVVGASGGIGSAVLTALEGDPRCGDLVGLHRRSEPALELTDEATIEAAAAHVRERMGGLDLVFDATGALTIDGHPPEKTIRRLDPAVMARSFQINAIGPALLLKHFSPLLPRRTRAIFATISARVGSVSDNRRGGWISYRSAKAALNQIVRTSAIEIAFRHPQTVVVGLQPGTVATRLSQPFVAADRTISPDESAARLLGVLDALEPADSGQLVDHKGTVIPP